MGGNGARVVQREKRQQRDGKQQIKQDKEVRRRTEAGAGAGAEGRKMSRR